MGRRALWIAVLAGSALSLATVLATVSQRLVIGSPEGGWVYRYLSRFTARPVEPLVIAIVLVVTAIAFTWRHLPAPQTAENTGRTPVHEWTLVIGWCVFALLIQILLRAAYPFTLGAIFRSDNPNSFYSVALKYDVRAILSGFEPLRPAWPLHAQSNLPGKLLLVRALTHVSTDPSVIGWLVVMVSNLGGVLLYMFVRDLFADRAAGVLAVILYLFVPAKLFFFPLLNIVTPVVVFGCSYLCLRWVTTRRPAYAAALGAVLYGLVLFEPTALVVGVLYSAFLAHALTTHRMTVRMALQHIAIGIAAFLGVYAVVYAAFGFDLLSAFRHISADAAAFNVHSGRPYRIWVIQNLVEFFLGAGLFQVVLFAAAFRDIALIASGIAGMVAVADLVGVNRGEVTRLWIFLACFWQIPAAWLCHRLNSRLAFTLLVVMTLVVDAMELAMVGFIEP